MNGEANAMKCQVNSRAFLHRVRQVLALRDFIVRELGQDQKRESSDTLTLDGLYGLEYARLGRSPDSEEWRQLEGKYFRMNLLLDPESRKKFALRQFPTLVIHVAIYSLLISLAALFFAVYPKLIPFVAAQDQSEILLPSFVVWNICLGALGSIAFISVNALSMQADVTFDITNVRFVVLRIILGSLFGVLIALPVAYDGFYNFCTDLAQIASRAKSPEQSKIDAVKSVYLLAPFLVGFSASLFMTIISRLIGFVQSLFGGDGAKPAPPVVVPPRSIMG